MIKATHIKWFLIAWFVMKILSFYFFPYYVVALSWFGMLFGFLALTIIQLVKLIRERNNTSRLRVLKTILFFALFLLTFYTGYVDRVIEKFDWKVFYYRRAEIVEQVKNFEINSNTDKPYWMYKLPYQFPVISNGGNEIRIERNDSLNTTTVEFWIFRNFFSSPSTHLIYTNEPDEIARIDRLINRHPEDNWKIRENWYRIYEE